jgi:hypothetical protein
MYRCIDVFLKRKNKSLSDTNHIVRILFYTTLPAQKAIINNIS